MQNMNASKFIVMLNFFSKLDYEHSKEVVWNGCWILFTHFYPWLTGIYFPYLLHFFLFFALHTKDFCFGTHTLFISPGFASASANTPAVLQRHYTSCSLKKNHRSCRCFNKEVKFAAVVSQEPDLNTFFHIEETENSSLLSM